MAGRKISDLEEKTSLQGTEYFVVQDGNTNKKVKSGKVGEKYSLPTASPSTLGGVKPKSKTSDMTEEVGVDNVGKLWTKPIGGGSTPLDVPQWFKDSIVCYYNPSKQGLTNKEIQEKGGNFTLKDFSDNHLDMQMHNFQGSGMSGMNGYGINIDSIKHTTSLISIESKSKYKAAYKVLTELTSSTNWAYIPSPQFETFKIKTFEQGIIISRGDTGKPLLTINPNSEFIFSKDLFNGNILLAFKDVAHTNDIIHLEILSTYEGALVFDNTNNYGEITNSLITNNGSVVCSAEDFIYTIKTNTLRLGGSTIQPLYYFFKFNRILNKEEIDWVCNNLISKENMISANGGYQRNLYESAGAMWNGKFYELNGLNDINEYEMSKIYTYSNVTNFEMSELRTNIAKEAALYNWDIDCTRFLARSNMVVWKPMITGYIRLLKMENICQEATQLREIICEKIDVGSISDTGVNSFAKCENLERLNIANLNANIDFHWSPKLSKESILYMITNAKASKPIIIKLHPTALAIANADSNILSALASKPNIRLQ